MINTESLLRLALLASLATLGCDPAPAEDAGVDAGADEDAGRDSGTDAGAADAGPDAGGGLDSGAGDGGVDAGPFDAGVDAGPPTPTVIGCRAVDALGTTSVGPVGVNPAYTSGNGGAGNPPESGDIASTNPFSQSYWDFDYVGLNTGAFDTTVQLTDAAGAHVGNPVVLMTAGHDYSALTDGSSCGAADTFQPVLEASLDGTLIDLAAASTSVTTALGSTQLRTTWMSGSPENVSVGADGRLSAVAENRCALIQWTVTSDDPSVAAIDASCTGGSFVACVDAGGVDTATRQLHLPVGDVDANLPGLPSGPPVPAVGGTVGITFVVNTGTRGLGAYAARTEYDEAVFDEDTSTDTQSIGGSTQNSVGLPFAVNPGVADQTRWNDVDAFASTSGIFDLATQTFTAVASGTTAFQFVNEELADGSACNIWIDTACMPYSSTPSCQPPPMGGYPTLAGAGSITIP